MAGTVGAGPYVDNVLRGRWFGKTVPPETVPEHATRRQCATRSYRPDLSKVAN